MSVNLYEYDLQAPHTAVFDERHELIQFPGGEWHVKGSQFQRNRNYCAVVRRASADDILALAVWADAVHRDGAVPHAVIPYFPGARQDRRQPGEALSARVYADIVNAMRLSSVSIVDPHSPVIVALIDRVNVLPSLPIAHLAMTYSGSVDVLIAPDAGALKRTEEVARLIGNVEVIQAHKKRDMTTGQLSGFMLPPLDKSLVYGVVDDICDGGGTFVGLAETAGLDRENLRLYVTHGIFSGQAHTKLPLYYGQVHTTDSIEQIDRVGFTVHTMNWERGVPL